MTMRITGMYSGLDTESIISELVSAKNTKVTKLKNEKTKLEWKQNVWQKLNTKIYGLYTDHLTDMRFESHYSKKKTSSSNENVASVVAGDSAVLGSQTLQVNSLAQAGYLTGAKIKGPVDAEKNPSGTVSTSTKLSEINSNLTGSKITVKVGDGEEKNINITEDMTVSSFVTALKDAGVNASFDATNQRFFINSKSMGADNDFTITGTSIDDGAGGSMSALRGLGLDTSATESEYESLFGTKSTATKAAGKNAEIVLNGATFSGNSNTFSVNGLTLNLKGTTAAGETLTITTAADTDGIYDMIKDFLSDYNDMMSQVSKYYNADSASDYDILTSEQKQSMTDEEIETWETTIKDSLLRRDGTLSTLMSSMSEMMSTPIMVNGKKTYLSDFGISTLNYFQCEDNEHYGYHIDGDPDDTKTSANEDKLKKMIATDPDAVTQFFTGLSKNLYGKLDKLMASTDYSSIYKIYNDKQMKEEYDDYKDKIKDAEKELANYQDKWYDKFSQMEVALSKLQSNQNAVSGMLGN